MLKHGWVEEFKGAITVCDPHGIILEMNTAAANQFSKRGGESLIGSNLLECHPPAARTKLESLMAEQRINAYTIEKNGKKRLIYQSPWYENGVYQGFVEIGVEIPMDMPHFIRP